MKTTTIRPTLLRLAAGTTLLLTAFPAFAAVHVNLDAALNASDSTTLHTSATTTAGGTNDAHLSTVITKGDQKIDARLTDLQKLNTRVQDMKNESATGKAAITTSVQTNSTGLTTLKAKLDADTDLSTARTDDTAITQTYRIYALVIPQGFLLASADRITTISGLMNALIGKLQTRISAAQTAGKNVTAATAAIADMQLKLTAANTEAGAIVSSVSSLTPDQGNITTSASNKAALIAARAHVKTATADLTAARKDVSIILSTLKSVDASVTATSSVSVGAH